MNNQINSSQSASLLPLFELNLVAAPVPSNQNQVKVKNDEKALFLGFSKNDVTFMDFIKAKICHVDSSFVDGFQSKPFQKITKKHLLYVLLHELLHHSQVPFGNYSNQPFTIAELIHFLRTKSPVEWQSTIEKTTLIGSLLEDFLEYIPSIVAQAIKDNFGFYFPPKILNKYINRAVERKRRNINPQCVLSEADLRLIYKGPHEGRLCLSQQARTFFLKRFPDSKHCVTKYMSMGQHTTVVKFFLASRAFEFIFSEAEKNCSSEDCLSINLDPLLDNQDVDLEIDCQNFSVAEYLRDKLCGIYRPSDLKNPECWIRLLLKSSRVGIGNYEQLMVENLLAPFHHELNQEKFEKILAGLNYKNEQIRRLLTKESFLKDYPSKAIALYVYSLIDRKIQAKKSEPDNLLTDEDFTKFVFNVCNSLHTYLPSCDAISAQIWVWVKEDQKITIVPRNLNFQNASLVELLSYASIHKNIPASVLSALLTLRYFIKNPSIFTFRQTPAIFFGPELLRIKIDPLTALKTLCAYAKITQNTKILQAIFDYPCYTEKNNCHALLISLLGVEEKKLIQETLHLIDQKDPFMCRLGIQIALIIPSWSNLDLLLSKLPKLIQERPLCGETLSILYNKSIEHFHLDSKSIRPLNCAQNVIALLIQTSQPSLMFLAFEMWKNQKVELPTSLGFKVLSKYCAQNPEACAIHLNQLLEERKPLHIQPLFDLFINISLSCKKRGIHKISSLLTTVEKIIHSSGDIKEIQAAELEEALHFFLEKFPFSDQLYQLALGLALKGYLKLASFPEPLQGIIRPLSNYLPSYLNDGKLHFTQSEINFFLKMFKTPENINFPLPVLSARLNIVCWIFHIIHQPQSLLPLPSPLEDLIIFFQFLMNQNYPLTLITDIPSNFQETIHSKKEWVKLLAQTKEPKLIKVSRQIIEKNKEDLPPKIDLILFEGLCKNHPEKALKMILIKKDCLDSGEMVVVINALRISLHNQNKISELIQLLPFFEKILAHPIYYPRDGKQKIHFRKSLEKMMQLVINKIEEEPRRVSFLIKAALYLVSNDEYDSFFKLISKNIFKDASLELLTQIDEVLIEKFILFYSLNKDWANLLMTYIKQTPLRTSRLDHLDKMVLLLKNSSTPLSHFLHFFSLVLDAYYPKVIPLNFRQLLDSNRENYIKPLEDSEDWEILQIYLKTYHTQRISLNSYEARAWNAIKRLLKAPEILIHPILQLLQTLSPEEWNKQFQVQDLDAIHRLFNILVDNTKVDDPQMIPYLISLFSYCLEHDLQKGIQMNCSDETWLDLAKLIEPYSVNTKIAKYLMLKRNIKNNEMTEIAKMLLNAQLKPTGDCHFVYKLITQYFPNDFQLWTKLWEKIISTEFRKINEILLRFEESFSLYSPELFTCWQNIFAFLGRTSHETIWPYLENLPISFNEENPHELERQEEMRTILIKEAAGILLKKTVSNSHKGKNKNLKKIQAFNDPRSAILLKHTLNCQRLNLETFLFVLSTLSKADIANELMPLLSLTLKQIKAYPESKSVGKAKSYRQLYHQKFLFLIQQAIKNPNPIHIEKAAKCLIFGKHIFSLQPVEMQKITKIIFPLYLNDLKEKSPALVLDAVFFINLSEQKGNAQLPESKNIHAHNPENPENPEKICYITSTIQKLWSVQGKSFEIHETFAPHSHDSTFIKDSLELALNSLDTIYFMDKETVIQGPGNIKVESIAQINKALRSIWSVDFEQTPSDYLTWVFEFLHALPRTPDYIQNLKYIIFTRMRRVIEKRSKNNLPSNNLRRMIEKGIEWDLKRLYQFYGEIPPERKLEKTQFSLPILLLDMAIKENIFQENDEWVFIYKHIVFPLLEMDSNQYELPLEKTIHAHLKILDILIGYDTPFSYYCTYKLFAMFVGQSDLVPEEIRIRLFKQIADAASRFPFVLIEGHTLLQYLNKHCFEVEEGVIFEQIKEGDKFHHYLIHLLDYENDICIKCYNQLNNDFSLSWRLHYTWLNLEILYNKLIYKAYRNKEFEYFIELEKLMLQAAALELLFMVSNEELSDNHSLPITKMSLTLCKCLQESFQSVENPHVNICHEKQFLLIKDFATIILNFPTNESPDLIDKQNEAVLMILVEVILMPDSIRPIKKDIIKGILSVLRERNLAENQIFYLNMIDIYIDPDYEKNTVDFAEKYIQLCRQYLDNTAKSFNWVNLYKILVDKLKLFKKHPHLIEYKEAFIAFLNTAHQISQKFDPKSENHVKATVAIKSYIDNGVDFQVITKNHQGTYQQYELIKASLLKISTHFDVPFQLNDLILKGHHEFDTDYESISEQAETQRKEKLLQFRNEVANFMPEFISWTKENQTNDRLDAFTKLFDYFSDGEKSHLLKLLETCQKSLLYSHRFLKK